MPVRSFVALVLFASLACTPSGDKAPKFQFDPGLRPDHAGIGVFVAKVHLFAGSVAIVPASGQSFAAKPGIPLLKSDTLKIGERSFVVLHLQNNRLARLESNPAMLVAHVAMIDAPPLSASVEQQLTGMLSADELSNSERIVGWHARMSGAQTVAAEKESVVRDEIRKSKEMKAQRLALNESYRKEEQAADKGLYKHKSMVAFGEDREEAAQDDAVAPKVADARAAVPKPMEAPPQPTSMAKPAGPPMPPASPPKIVAPAQPRPSPVPGVVAGRSDPDKPRPPAKQEAKKKDARRHRVSKKVASTGAHKVIGTKGPGGGGGSDLDELLKNAAGMETKGGETRTKMKASSAPKSEKGHSPIKRVRLVKGSIRAVTAEDPPADWKALDPAVIRELRRAFEHKKFIACLKSNGTKLGSLILELKLSSRRFVSMKVVDGVKPSQAALKCIGEIVRRIRLSKDLGSVRIRLVVRLF